MTPKSIEVSLRKERGFLEQVPMMREETFCDIFLLVSMINSIVTCNIANHVFKDMHVKKRKVKLNAELKQIHY